MSKLSVKERMVRSIALRKGEVVMRDDFKTMGSASQVSRALKALIEDGKIIRLGYGTYAKSRAKQALRQTCGSCNTCRIRARSIAKLGVTVRLGRAQAEYASGKPHKFLFAPRSIRGSDASPARSP